MGELPGYRPAKSIPPERREMLRMLGYSDAEIDAMIGAATEPPPAASGVSLIITKAQREALRALGCSDAEIHAMTPEEAHRRLGL
jgi:hypothetical protein